MRIIQNSNTGRKIALRWMPHNLTNEKSNLKIAWRYQAITRANVDTDLGRQVASLGPKENAC